MVLQTEFAQIKGNDLYIDDVKATDLVKQYGTPLYVYDEENEYYVCEVDLDEDDMVRFLKGDVRACPYYQSDDEYKIVRKQI